MVRLPTNTIAFNYWLVRFICHSCYIFLVWTAIILQIGGGSRVTEGRGIFSDPSPEGLYIAIIVVAFILLWRELVKLRNDKQGCIWSFYNMVDILVFLLPLAGAVNQIMIMHNIVELGLNPGLLSFSLLIVGHHLLLELRVFQVYCQFVSIIIRAIDSIRIFGFVFVGLLPTFAIAILHISHACVDAEHCSYFKDGLTTNIMRALSAAYFMLAGKYDQLEGGFTSNNVAFHALMMMFFFYTVILTLNILHALINKAIIDGDQKWKLDWLKCRMRHVESAENLSYDIPGFREKYNYFPDKIYYTGTPQQVRNYEEKTRQTREESAPSTIMPANETKDQPSSNLTVTVGTTITTASEKSSTYDDKLVVVRWHTEFQKQLGTERERSEKQIGELQQQLRMQQQFQKEQHQVLKEQQGMLVQILAKLNR